jgi:hypothetical protein
MRKRLSTHPDGCIYERAFTKSGWTATPSLDAGEEPERSPVVGVVLAPSLIVIPMLAAVKTRVDTALKTT